MTGRKIRCESCECSVSTSVCGHKIIKKIKIQGATWNSYRTECCMTRPPGNGANDFVGLSGNMQRALRLATSG